MKKTGPASAPAARTSIILSWPIGAVVMRVHFENTTVPQKFVKPAGKKRFGCTG